MSKKDFASMTDAERERAEREAEVMPSEEEQRTAELRDTFNRSAPRVGDFLGDALDLMMRRAEGKARPIATPWPAVNEALGGGLWPGLHVLTGATGEGKSQWALQVALSAATAGTPTLYIGLELGRVDLVARLLSLMMAETNPRSAPKWSDLFLGRNADALRVAYDTHAPKLAELPLRLEVARSFAGWSANSLFFSAEAMREEHPEIDGPGSRPLLIVLDYLQVIASPENERQDIRERIGRAAYAARMVARDHGAAVLMLSSIAREHLRMLAGHREKGELGNAEKLHPRELVGLGKESGEIEYAADSVLAMCRGEESEIHLAVAKVRAGSQSWQRLRFNGGWFSAETDQDRRSREEKERAAKETKREQKNDPSGYRLPD